MTNYVLVSNPPSKNDPSNKFKEHFEDYWRHLAPEIRSLFFDRTVYSEDQDNLKGDLDVDREN